MASADASLTLDFLTDAGHLLAETAPETSAFLMAQRSNLMFEYDLPVSDIQRQHVCTCCGHIMLLGQGSTLKILHRKALTKKERAARQLAAKSRQRQQPDARPGITKQITCGHCKRLTEVKFPAPEPVQRRKVKKAAKGGSVAPTAGTASGPATTSSSLSQAPSQGADSQKPGAASANSKKRAKSRKAGLQALLDQAKNKSSRPGLGLSLADFMQK